MPKEEITDLIGKQGQRKGKQKLQAPHDLQSMALRFGLYLSRELRSHGYEEDCEGWNQEVPGPVNASVVEGVCGRLKHHWKRANNPRTRDEILRAMCVLSSTTLVPRALLWGPEFREWCLSRARNIEGGGDRNEREADARLNEHEDGHLKRKRTMAKKHTSRTRRSSAKFVTAKKELESLRRMPELFDQCYIRSMSTHRPLWQQLDKDELVKLCIKYKQRTAFLPGAAEENETETEACSDQIELDYDGDDGDDGDDSTSEEDHSPPRARWRGK
eukprot:Hpha_TRINITY_DN15805_c1_g5::TRINITY_DN15805_c1_g5_i3::g.190219::m.190219